MCNEICGFHGEVLKGTRVPFSTTILILFLVGFERTMGSHSHSIFCFIIIGYPIQPWNAIFLNPFSKKTGKLTYTFTIRSSFQKIGLNEFKIFLREKRFLNGFNDFGFFASIISKSQRVESSTHPRALSIPEVSTTELSLDPRWIWLRKTCNIKCKPYLFIFFWSLRL